MELQLVTIEQAKVLEEIGFPFHENFTGLYPTLELVARWLREEKSVIVIPEVNPCYNFVMYSIQSIYDTDGNFIGSLGRKLFNTYEEALSAGIDKVIEILKKQ